MNGGILRNVPFPNAIETLYHREELCIAMRDLQRIADAYYLGVANGEITPTAESCTYFKNQVQRIDAMWMENKYELCDERRIKSDIESEKSVDSIVLLETLKCMCTINIFISDDELLERTSMVSVLDIPSVERQRLAMANGPILEYTVSELRDALWQFVSMWKCIHIDNDVLWYIEILELRYAMFLRCAFDETVHDLQEYRQAVEDSFPPVYTCTPAMMSEMTAQFGGLCDAVWTRQAFDTQTIFSSEHDYPPLELVSKVARTLRAFSEITKSVSALQKMYTNLCMDSSLRPGEVDIFAPENPLYPVSAHNVVIMCRGSKQHSAVQNLSLRKMRDVLQIVCDKIDTAKTAKEATLTWDEEIAVVCAADMLFKNRFRLDWESTFVVYQAEFRRNRQKFSGDGLPLLFNNCTRFNVWHGGTLFETNNVVASFAVWLDIVRRDYGGRAEGRNILDLCNLMDPNVPDFSFKSALGSKTYKSIVHESTGQRGRSSRANTTIIELQKAV